MLFLKILGMDLLRLTKLTGGNQALIDSLSLCVFREGLHTLEKNGFDVRTAMLPKPNSPMTAFQERSAELDDLIRAHYETSNDCEIGRMMSPPMLGSMVKERRLGLGLKKVAGAMNLSRINKLVDPIEFELMVNEEGYTMAEFLKFKGFTFTRERMRQIAEQMGLKHSPEDRTPAWKLVRRARKIGNVNLANREWLTEKVSAASSMTALAAELEITVYNMFVFIRAFGLTHPSFRKYGATAVTLECAWCGKPFPRLEESLTRVKKRKTGESNEYYCTPKCGAKGNRAQPKKPFSELTLKRLKKVGASRKKMCGQIKFICGNWEKMSDPQIAGILGIEVSSVTKKRLELGLTKRK